MNQPAFDLCNSRALKPVSKRCSAQWQMNDTPQNSAFLLESRGLNSFSKGEKLCTMVQETPQVCGSFGTAAFRGSEATDKGVLNRALKLCKQKGTVEIKGTTLLLSVRIKMPFSVENQNAIVTGAASGMAPTLIQGLSTHGRRNQPCICQTFGLQRRKCGHCRYTRNHRSQRFDESEQVR